jgi:uncharacterized protein YbjT (DUF2867 family)
VSHRVAVAGGTGVVGRLVVERLRSADVEPVVLARSVGLDAMTGHGLDDALRDADAIVDVTNVVTNRRSTAERFFTTATRNLLDAGRRAGVRHHVVLSIVGCDRVDLGYYLAKRRQEQLVLEANGTVLRATQFHEFPGQLLDRIRGPIAVAPRMRSQTVAATEVADELVRLALAEPQGLAPELAGPEVHEMPDLVRRVLAHRHSRRLPLTVPIPGRAGKQMAAGGLLPLGEGPRGTATFDEWLAGQR